MLNPRRAKDNTIKEKLQAITGIATSEQQFELVPPTLDNTMGEMVVPFAPDATGRDQARTRTRSQKPIGRTTCF